MHYLAYKQQVYRAKPLVFNNPFASLRSQLSSHKDANPSGTSRPLKSL